MTIQVNEELLLRSQAWQHAMHAAAEAAQRTDDQAARDALLGLMHASGLLCAPLIAVATDELKQRQAAAMN